MASDGPTRPPDVLERFRRLTAENREHVHAHPELALRVELSWFITSAARQRHQDLPVSATLDQFYAAYFALREPGQRRTGSDFEKRCIDTVQRPHPLVDDYAERNPEAGPPDVADAVQDYFVRVPPATVLGETGPESNFGLICWNAAHVLVEGIVRPCWAARPVVHAGYRRPADVYGFLPALAPLTERYEDHPDGRPAAAEEITGVLTRFLEVAPWPLDRVC